MTHNFSKKPVPLTKEEEKIRIDNISKRAAAEISEAYVISVSNKAFTTPGIYFLIKEKRIVYIGQSKNLLSRIGSHASVIDFDSYSVTEVDDHLLDVVEKHLIKRFSPKYNVMHNGMRDVVL